MCCYHEKEVGVKRILWPNLVESCKCLVGDYHSGDAFSNTLSIHQFFLFRII